MKTLIKLFSLTLLFTFLISINLLADKKEVVKEWKKDFNEDSKTLIKKKKNKNQRTLKYQFPSFYSKKAKLFSIFDVPVFFSTHKSDSNYIREAKFESNEDKKRRLRD